MACLNAQLAVLSEAGASHEIMSCPESPSMMLVRVSSPLQNVALATHVHARSVHVQSAPPVELSNDWVQEWALQ